MRQRKKLVHRVKAAEVELRLSLLDRHCRSHNIAAECCVRSSDERADGLASTFSKAGGGKALGKVEVSKGSCLMCGLPAELNRSSGDAGLEGSCTEP